MYVPSVVQQNQYKDFPRRSQVKRIVFFVAAIILVYSMTADAAGENNGLGVNAIGMANAYTAVANDPWAIQYNPSGLAQISEWCVSGFYVPDQFGLPELQTMAVAVTVPFKKITIGVSLDRFGFDLYNETTLSLAAGTSIAKTIRAGMTINSRFLNISRYGNAKKITCDAGIMAELVPSVNIGGCVKNILNASFVKGDDDIPQSFNAGVCWRPAASLLLSVEAEKDIRYDASIKAGIEKSFLQLLSLRFGIATNPDTYSAGVSLKYAGVEFGYAGYSHNELGWTHQIEVSLHWGGSDGAKF